MQLIGNLYELSIYRCYGTSQTECTTFACYFFFFSYRMHQCYWLIHASDVRINWKIGESAFEKSLRLFSDLPCIRRDLLALAAWNGRAGDVRWERGENTSCDARTTKSRKPSAVKPRHFSNTSRALESDPLHEKLFPRTYVCKVSSKEAATIVRELRLDLWIRWIYHELPENAWKGKLHSRRLEFKVTKFFNPFLSRLVFATSISMDSRGETFSIPQISCEVSASVRFITDSLALIAKISSDI